MKTLVEGRDIRGEGRGIIERNNKRRKTGNIDDVKVQEKKERERKGK